MRRKDKKKKRPIDEKLVVDSVRKTLASMEAGRGRRRHRRREDGEGAEIATEELKTLRVNEFITVGELANAMQVKPQEVLQACLDLGIMASINRRLDKDAIEIVADEFGFKAEFVTELYRLCDSDRCVATITVSDRVLLKLDGSPDPKQMPPEMRWVKQLTGAADSLPRVAAIQGSAINARIRRELVPRFADAVHVFDSIGPTGKVIVTITAKAASKGAALRAGGRSRASAGTPRRRPTPAPRSPARAGSG